MEKSDSYLVEKSQGGDLRSFELLVVKYQQRIFNVIFRIVRDRDIVEDLAQEAFLNAYKSINSFKGHSSFYTWIYRIASNISLNYLSKQKRAVFVDNENILETEAVLSKSPGKGMSPEKMLQDKETFAEISNVINSLPDDIKTAVVLREYEGLSYEDIAEIVECPIGTVRSRIFRGRAMLKEKLKDHL